MDFIKQIKASFKKWKKNKKQAEVKAPRKEVCQTDGGDDYVQEEEIEFKICLARYEFYKCEMPSETLARIKARQDSLSRMQGVPLGLKPFCPLRNPSLAEESTLSRTKLLSAEAFARECSEGNDSHEEEGNYLDMSDPPNYDDFMYLRISEHEPEDSDYIKLIDKNGYKTHPLPTYYEVMR